MDDCAFEKLTAAERGVLRAALGRTNDGVATVLGISPATVAAHMLSARRKLGSPPRGEASRLFVEWEQATQKPPSPYPTMVAPNFARHPVDADAELVREVRSPFVFLDHPEPVAVTAAPPAEATPLLRFVLVLTLVVLTLACIRFLPDLRERAEEAGRIIRPILDEAGVKRSG